MRSLIRLVFIASHLIYYSTITSLDLQSDRHANKKDMMQCGSTIGHSIAALILPKGLKN